MQPSGTQEEIFARGEATIAVATTLKNGDSAYEWDELSNADFAAKIAAARAARQVADGIKADYDAQRGLTNAHFDELERLKTQALGMAKYRFSKDERQSEMVGSVGEYGESREATLKEADEWSAAWQNIDPS